MVEKYNNKELNLIDPRSISKEKLERKLEKIEEDIKIFEDQIKKDSQRITNQQIREAEGLGTNYNLT